MKFVICNPVNFVNTEGTKLLRPQCPQPNLTLAVPLTADSFHTFLHRKKCIPEKPFVEMSSEAKASRNDKHNWAERQSAQLLGKRGSKCGVGWSLRPEVSLGAELTFFADPNTQDGSFPTVSLTVKL